MWRISLGSSFTVTPSAHELTLFTCEKDPPAVPSPYYFGEQAQKLIQDWNGHRTLRVQFLSNHFLLLQWIFTPFPYKRGACRDCRGQKQREEQTSPVYTDSSVWIYTIYKVITASTVPWTHSTRRSGVNQKQELSNRQVCLSGVSESFIVYFSIPQLLELK